MRTKLFKEIYKLLEEIAPQSLQYTVNENENFFLEHDYPNDKPSLYIKNISNDLLVIGREIYNEEGFPDVIMYVMYDKKRKIARAANFRPVKNGKPFQVQRDINADEYDKEERKENDFLKIYLTGLKDEVKQDPSFFSIFSYEEPFDGYISSIVM